MTPSRKQASAIIERLRGEVRHEPCWTCDCLQGLLTQLKLDAQEDIADLAADLEVPRERMHGCLGCDPCPPGEVYSDYLRQSQARPGEGGTCGCKDG